ncbi:beta-1,3-galactosyltransferase 5-like isoform X2 [Babylonia areolata]
MTRTNELIAIGCLPPRMLQQVWRRRRFLFRFLLLFTLIIMCHFLLSYENLQKPEDFPEFFVPRSQQQFSLEYPYLYRASRACQTPVDMLVMTLSRPQNSQERQAVRETWGSVVTTRTWPGPTPQTLPKSVALIFLMGEDRKLGPIVSDAVRLESEKYGDIVQWEGLQDAYFNLTLKVLLGLRWVNEFCPNVSHVMKTDDDTFVHVPRLQHLLSTNSTDLIWGPYAKSEKCYRKSKRAVSREGYPLDIYPPHVKGNLYVLPGESVARMVAVAPYLPYNNMEDVHVTGTLARTLALSHRAFTRKEFSKVPKAPDPCLFQDNGDSVGSQMVSTELAFHFWKTFSGKYPCRAFSSACSLGFCLVNGNFLILKMCLLLGCFQFFCFHFLIF